MRNHLINKHNLKLSLLMKLVDYIYCKMSLFVSFPRPIIGHAVIVQLQFTDSWKWSFEYFYF